MFNKNSDYALNKLNPDAIVCSSVTGVNVELTCEQFANEEEFLFWKQWSDDDYKVTEDNGRGYYDHTISLIEELDAIGVSFEDKLIALLERYERDRKCAEQVAQIRSVLTEKQFRRLWMHLVDKVSAPQIAASENVSEHSVYMCIRSAKNKIFKNFDFFEKTL